MYDYISREAVIDALEKERDYLLKNGRTGAEHVLVHHALNVVDEIPVKDVRRNQMIKIKLTETQIEVFGHGTDETCSRVTQFLYDLEIMYILFHRPIYDKFEKKGMILFDPGHTLISWDYTIDYNLRQFIEFMVKSLKSKYPNTIELE